MSPNSNSELFYVDDSGKKVDADLHSEMLDGISPEGKARILKSTKNLAKELGLTPDQIKALYG